MKSTTLDQELISAEKGCYKIWGLSKKTKYQQLSWLPEIDLPALDLNSLNGCVMNTELKSWFSTLKIQPQKKNLEKTSWQSSKFIVVDGMAPEDTKTTKRIKSFKLKLNPTNQQRLILNQWAGGCRYLYNKTISLLQNKNNKTLRGKYYLRDRLVTIKSRTSKNENSFYYNKPWLKQCPKSVRQYSVQEACSNLKACFSNLKNGNISKFNSPYKTKKKEQLHGWTISLEKNNLSKDQDHLYIFKNMLNEMKYFNTKQLHKLITDVKPSMDCKIQKNKYNEYFLIIPIAYIPKAVKKEVINPVAIDPGIRKFLTTYAPNAKESFIFGNRWSTKITEHCIFVDKLVTLYSKRKTKQLKKQILRKRKKIEC